MEIKNSVFKSALKPFDVVTNPEGDVGFIREVGVNEDQWLVKEQIKYAVHWIVGNETMGAWWYRKDLTFHCNFFIEIARSLGGGNSEHVQRLFNNMNR